MVTNTLEGNALFQLNVLLWATFRQSISAPTDSTLYKAGYQAFAIEQPLRPSAEEREFIEDLPHNISRSPVADALIRVCNSTHFIIVECKPTSFGIDTKQAKQARGLLRAAVDIPARGLSVEAKTAEVYYIVPKSDMNAMKNTLDILHDSAPQLNISSCRFGVIGVSIESNSVYLISTRNSTATKSLQNTVAPKTKVFEFTKDPRPLYIIPWIPESNINDLDALGEKLRAHLISIIAKGELGTTKIDFMELLNAVSNNAYSLWRNRKSLRGEVNSQVGSILQALTKGKHPVKVRVRTSSLQIDIESEEDREALKDSIRRAKVGKSEDLQLSFY